MRAQSRRKERPNSGRDDKNKLSNSKGTAGEGEACGARDGEDTKVDGNKKVKQQSKRGDPSEINQIKNKHTSKGTLKPKQLHVLCDRIVRLLLVLLQIRDLHCLS